MFTNIRIIWKFSKWSCTWMRLTHKKCKFRLKMWHQNCNGLNTDSLKERNVKMSNYVPRELKIQLIVQIQKSNYATKCICYFNIVVTIPITISPQIMNSIVFIVLISLTWVSNFFVKSFLFSSILLGLCNLFCIPGIFCHCSKKYFKKALRPDYFHWKTWTCYSIIQHLKPSKMRF